MKQYPEDIKTMFGISVMSVASLTTTTLISSFLLLYITDYSGIYYGIAGKAATTGASMLVIARLLDALTAPFLGYVMDRSHRTRWGKFKPYIFGSIVITTSLIIAIFNNPVRLSDVIRVGWLYVCYFLFEIAHTLLPINPLIQTLSDKAEIRSKLLVAPRIVILVFSTVLSAFLSIAIALGPDGKTPNFGLATLLVMLPLAALSLLGVVLVKEGSVNTGEEQVTASDMIKMLKTNKPLFISMLGRFLGGFTSNIFVATSIYYGKYAFGMKVYSEIVMLQGVLVILTIIISTFISHYLMKHVTPAVGIIISSGITFVPLVALFVLNLGGPITSVPLYLSLVALMFLGTSLAYIPWNVISMECMDYNKYKIGKSMQGITSAMNAFITKLQAALGVALTGVVLAAIGYDPEAYDNISSIPATLFTGLGFVQFAMPAIFTALAIVVVMFYPLRKKKERNEMYSQMEKLQQEISN